MPLGLPTSKLKPDPTEKKMLTSIFKSIYIDLRSEYVLNKEMLEDRYVLWTAPETRFGDCGQEQTGLKAFLVRNGTD